MGRQVDSGAPGRGEAEQVPGRHLALGPGEQQPGGRPPPEGQAGDGLRGALHGQRAPQPALRVPERDKVAEGEAVDRSVTAPAAGSAGQAAELQVQEEVEAAHSLALESWPTDRRRGEGEQGWNWRLATAPRWGLSTCRHRGFERKLNNTDAKYF